MTLPTAWSGDKAKDYIEATFPGVSVFRVYVDPPLKPSFFFTTANVVLNETMGSTKIAAYRAALLAFRGAAPDHPDVRITYKLEDTDSAGSGCAAATSHGGSGATATADAVTSTVVLVRFGGNTAGGSALAAYLASLEVIHTDVPIANAAAARLLPVTWPTVLSSLLAAGVQNVRYCKPEYGSRGTSSGTAGLGGGTVRATPALLTVSFDGSKAAVEAATRLLAAVVDGVVVHRTALPSDKRTRAMASALIALRTRLTQAHLAAQGDSESGVTRSTSSINPADDSESDSDDSGSVTTATRPTVIMLVGRCADVPNEVTIVSLATAADEASQWRQQVDQLVGAFVEESVPLPPAGAVELQVGKIASDFGVQCDVVGAMVTVSGASSAVRDAVSFISRQVMGLKVRVACGVCMCHVSGGVYGCGCVLPRRQRALFPPCLGDDRCRIHCGWRSY